MLSLKLFESGFCPLLGDCPEASRADRLERAVRILAVSECQEFLIQGKHGVLVVYREKVLI